MDIDTIWRFIDEGSTPAIAAIAYFLWRLDVHLREFTAARQAEQESRDNILQSIKDDQQRLIRKLAGMNGE